MDDAPSAPVDLLEPSDTFAHRHLGPSEAEIEQMLARIGCESLDALVDQTVPDSIRLASPLRLTGLGDRAPGEREVLERLRAIASENRPIRSCIGMGYADTIVPPVIQRNVLENPGWYTQYTPYQAEISQGRLEALLNFQTMIADLTGLPLANASLLDEATAAAEAMALCHSVARGRKPAFLVAEDCHPQTISVLRTRAESMGIALEVGPPEDFDFEATPASGVLLQYPTTHGRLVDPTATIERAHASDAKVVMAADILALTLLTPPGEFGADVAVGSTQRFGVPMGFGGPHAAYFATRDEFARKLPGRLVGVSVDAHGDPAYRLAIQTREQHIRRDKATSNICTAQVLLAIMASFYAVYHGPDGLRRIARRVRALTGMLADGLSSLGHDLDAAPFFDTLTLKPVEPEAKEVIAAALEAGYNLRDFGDGRIGVALDETTTRSDVERILAAFTPVGKRGRTDAAADGATRIPPRFERSGDLLTHPVFHAYRTEHEMLRYLQRLQSRDLSLTTSMIPLGSCTMKLNATTEMIPVTWPEFASLHPFAPADQTRGYATLLQQLETWLAELTGLPAVSLQPNAGSQGEYAGLLAIGRHHASQGEPERKVCLIPVSAHGTNAASAVIAGFDVVAVQCDDRGNVDLGDLRARCDEHRNELGALMLTYPSTHGVFEAQVKEMCEIVHGAGGQVYMDGANMNAQVGLTSPAEIGADVCHLNLHKTFCIPHGGGGPGMGPIAAAKHLAPFLPGDPLSGSGAVSAAPYGSPSILPISWVYIALMGSDGLTRATSVAILSANYMATRLEKHYEILYVGGEGRVGHEFIIDCRPFERSAGVRVEDIAKRLMDYGFHAPTMSFPVAGTLMIEPTECESMGELDRLCDALIAIREEIQAVESGELDGTDNPLHNAPHTAEAVSADEWPHPYSRSQAAYPAPWLREHKYWPPVGRIDNAYGDRNLVCTCPPLDTLVRGSGD
jgi:glycine dehydrogenase